MGIAITLGGKTKHEGGKNKHNYSFFGRSEAESLPRLIQFGTPVLFQSCSFCRGPTMPLMHNRGIQQGAEQGYSQQMLVSLTLEDYRLIPQTKVT